MRATAARRDLPSLAEAFGKADTDIPQKRELEESAMPSDGVHRSGHKTHAPDRRETRMDALDTAEPASDEKKAGVPETATSSTDVGNLLEMLASPDAMPHAAATDASAAVAAAGGLQEGNRPARGKTSPAAEIRADAAHARADGAKVPQAAEPIFVKSSGPAATSAASADAGAAMDAGDLQQSDADQLFRLIRSDGKGRDVEMSFSGGGDRATFRDAKAADAKVETVTVIDSRRYIGLAQTGNAAAVTTAIAHDPEWAASLTSTGRLTHSEAVATGKVVNTLKIQMNPIELGLVTATLRLHGDELTVSLQVQTGEAYRQLTEDQDAIVKSLRDQGFAVDQVSVQLSPADRGSGTSQGDSQSQQFSSQPQTREGGNSRQGGGEQPARNFGREETSHEGSTAENGPGLAGGQSVRSGGVYL